MENIKAPKNKPREIEVQVEYSRQKRKALKKVFTRIMLKIIDVSEITPERGKKS